MAGVGHLGVVNLDDLAVVLVGLRNSLAPGDSSFIKSQVPILRSSAGKQRPRKRRIRERSRKPCRCLQGGASAQVRQSEASLAALSLSQRHARELGRQRRWGEAGQGREAAQRLTEGLDGSDLIGVGVDGVGELAEQVSTLVTRALLSPDGVVGLLGGVATRVGQLMPPRQPGTRNLHRNVDVLGRSLRDVGNLLVVTWVDYLL